MPPNSFAEWIVGRNCIPRDKKKSKTHTSNKNRDVWNLALNTNDRAQSDTIQLTYPRTGRSTRVVSVNDTDQVRRIHDMHQIKQLPVVIPVDSDTESDSSEESCDCTCCSQAVCCCPYNCCCSQQKDSNNTKQVTFNDTKQEYEYNNHDTSPAVINVKQETKQPQAPQADNSKQITYKTEPATDDATSESEAEASPKKETPKKKGNAKGKNNQEAARPATQKGQQNKQQGNQGKQQGGKAMNKNWNGNKSAKLFADLDVDDAQDVEEDGARQRQREERREAVRQSALTPRTRQANSLLPPQRRVLDVEHLYETDQDPRPNAFFDNVNSSARVYHGPAYGNPYGGMYPSGVNNQPGPGAFGNGPQNIMQDAWGNRYIPASGRQLGRPLGPAPPPHMRQQAPQPQPQINPNNWYQGDGCVNIGEPVMKSPPAKPQATKVAPPSDRGGQSNVMPTVERASSHGSNKSMNRTKNWRNGNGSWNGEKKDLLSSLNDMILNDRVEAIARTSNQSKSRSKTASKEPTPMSGAWGNQNRENQSGGDWAPGNDQGWDGNNAGEWGFGDGNDNGSNNGNGNGNGNGNNSPRHSPNNVFGGAICGHDNNSNNGNGFGSHNGSRNGSRNGSGGSYGYPPRNHVPGSWPATSPARPKGRHLSPDNVFGDAGNASEWPNDFGDGDGNQRSGWQDPTAAQSSGGAFDNDDNNGGAWDAEGTW
ncbi:uncharacterized protein F4822DRAFT_29392 [Hypoxylon trugodes]|uniref:uncharacterized protein n=1 Tax=Hypoxylon trugodes TaxID=326681 RepID=UPI002193B7BB|nr:uncharacterized protein F4822DRAFT_29392 [Hypoxylon trugodes]KAI1393903.1 hypothetical protein F4822DRAFT_29392 [Hypoxylon trugodes]